MNTLRCFVILIVGLLSSPANAQGSYWIDDAIQECKAASGPYAVLAASSVGVYFCIHGPKKGDFSGEALQFCNKQIPAMIRSQARCQIVWTNGRLVDKKFYAAMAKDLAIPVAIRSTDGVNKQELSYKGTVVIGKTIAGKNDVRIMVDGKQICRGWIDGVEMGRSKAFVVRCLDSLKLSGSVTLKGLRKIGGFTRAAAFTALIKNPPHQMRIISQ